MQRNEIRMMLENRSIYLKGPPASGKTYLALRIVYELLQSDTWKEALVVHYFLSDGYTDQFDVFSSVSIKKTLSKFEIRSCFREPDQSGDNWQDFFETLIGRRSREDYHEFVNWSQIFNQFKQTRKRMLIILDDYERWPDDQPKEIYNCFHELRSKEEVRFVVISSKNSGYIVKRSEEERYFRRKLIECDIELPSPLESIEICKTYWNIYTSDQTRPYLSHYKELLRDDDSKKIVNICGSYTGIIRCFLYLLTIVIHQMYREESPEIEEVHNNMNSFFDFIKQNDDIKDFIEILWEDSMLNEIDRKVFSLAVVAKKRKKPLEYVYSFAHLMGYYRIEIEDLALAPLQKSLENIEAETLLIDVQGYMKFALSELVMDCVLLQPYAEKLNKSMDSVTEEDQILFDRRKFLSWWLSGVFAYMIGTILLNFLPIPLPPEVLLVFWLPALAVFLCYALRRFRKGT